MKTLTRPPFVKIRKTYFTAYLLLLIIPASLFGQEDNASELVKLLNNNEFFKSREFYHQQCSTISPDIDLFYKFRMAQFLDKKDSCAIYLEKIFSEYPDLFEEDKINAYGVLFDTYIDLRNNEKGLCTYERVKQYLNENPYNVGKEELEQLKKDNENRLFQLKYAMKQPPISVKRKNTNDSVRILGALKPLIMARFNNLPHKAILDTGVRRHCIMSKSMAEHMGVKCDTLEINNVGINENSFVYKAIIDSIEVGNIVFYNIPIEVVPDINSSFSDTSSVCLAAPIKLGLPLMQLIGKFVVDYEKKRVAFPVCNDTRFSLKEPNLFIHHDFLFTHLMINDKEFTGFLNTGAEAFMGIDPAYYEKNKNDIKLDTVIALLPCYINASEQDSNSISYTIPYNPIIKFEDRVIRVFTKRSIMIHSLSSIMDFEYFDGIIGYHWFKRLGKKVLLDLDNMRLESVN